MDIQNCSLSQLKQLHARIGNEITNRNAQSKAALVKRFRALAGEFGLTLEEVIGEAAAPAREKKALGKPTKTRAPAPIKFRHPSNKDLAWSGRGRRPGWVEMWVANGGAMEALEISAQKVNKKQRPSAVASAVEAEAVPA